MHLCSTHLSAFKVNRGRGMSVALDGVRWTLLNLFPRDNTPYQCHTTEHVRQSLYHSAPCVTDIHGIAGRQRLTMREREKCQMTDMRGTPVYMFHASPSCGPADSSVWRWSGLQAESEGSQGRCFLSYHSGWSEYRNIGQAFHLPHKPPHWIFHYIQLQRYKY